MCHERSRIWYFFLSLLCLIHVYLFVFPLDAVSKREHLVYFPNTAYELDIYKIYGKKPGKTLMLIGGIQGNEPGGFLSADLYADMSLEKGNLIVVPRANFYSIILNQRGPNGDMNRKFTPEENASSTEDQIVSILKKLISESDYLLNLHDGSGYYHPEYINKWRNPTCFGQAIIADCEQYRIPGTDRVIKLGDMARKIIQAVNPHIPPELHKFHFMNTKTDEKGSPHREQQRSATYYALTTHHIPAFGVETSKFLPSIDLKVWYHNLVINAFKQLFDIVPEHPGLMLDPPVLKYLVVSINNKVPMVVKKDDKIALSPGDILHVAHIEANYERGLSLDILGCGGLNDYRKDQAIFGDTSIIVRKDNHILAEIPVTLSAQGSVDAGRGYVQRSVTDFVVEAKGLRVLISNGETLEMVKGETMKLVDVLPKPHDSEDITVNFKGFVGDWKKNSGEDRGYLIHTGRDLMRRYALNEAGDSYEILASHGEDVLGRMYIRLLPLKLDYVFLKVNNQKSMALRPDEILSLSSEDRISFEGAQTNLSNQEELQLHINGHILNRGENRRVLEICPPRRDVNHQMDIRKGPLLLGKIFLRRELDR